MCIDSQLPVPPGQDVVANYGSCVKRGGVLGGSEGIAVSFRHLPRDWSAPLLAVRCALVVVAGLVVGLHLFGESWDLSWHAGSYRPDLDLYRHGGQAWLHGRPLYDTAAWTGGAPFTYPPFAAVLFSPLAVASLSTDGALLTLISIALTGVVIVITLRAQGHRPAVWGLVAITSVALLLQPVRATLGMGQINLVLLAAVVADVLLMTIAWPRGLLVGLAAAVKLTPLVGVLFFVLRGDRRAVLVALVSFVAATALGAVLAPRDSLRYWTWAVFSADRIGKPISAPNQNVRAVVARLGLTGPIGIAVWVLAAVVVVGLVIVAARRALRASQPGLALVLVGVAGLLASPMSWSHHWVWCVPALLVLADLGRVHRIPRWLAITGLVLFLISPHALLPHHGATGEHWALWQQVIGAGYVLWALLLL
ncbi:MAG TPA: glycosyltransferase 87 family protein, partial [Pseudonocardiaceae bacterium]|nr:glycosyltransferase 87 family protein [Pseudonocardiaceae bacterium]